MSTAQYQGREVIEKINRIEFAMLAGFDPISAQKELDAMSMTKEPYLLDNYPVLHQTSPVCRKGFGDNDCDMPMCDCGEMPLREMPDEEHMDQIDAAREPRRPASFKHLAVMCLATAMFTVLAIVSSPALLARAAEILKSWL